MNHLACLACLIPLGICHAAGNLAPMARVSASSEHSAAYLAGFAIDGIVPDAGGKDDAGKAWAVNGPASGGKGEFMLEWPAPVQVAEIVYFGRTGWSILDTWKDYEVYFDDAADPAATGQLQPVHGPQRIKMSGQTVRKIRIRFPSAHGNYNPGASEIAVYASSPSEKDLAAFTYPPSPLRDKLESGALGFKDILVIQRHTMDLSHVYTYHAEGFQPGGGLYVHTPGPDGGKSRELVASPDGEIIDCDLSCDAREVLFSWKRKPTPHYVEPNKTTVEHSRENPEENYQVFRINIDGTGLTQLTDGKSNNLNACWLPDGGIAFISDRKPAYAYCYVVTSPVMYRMERDGSNQKRLSSNYLMDFTPSVLGDGRIIYTRWEYVDRPAIPIQSLWVMHPDGTGVSGFFGNRVLDPGTFMQARAIPGTSKVICMMTGHNGSARGAIGIIDSERGSNAQESILNLTPEINIGRVDKGNGNILCNAGPYEAPYPLDQEHFLVSRNGEIQLRRIDATCAPTGVLKPKNGMGFYNPIPIMPRIRPPVIESHLPVDAVEPTATVFITDVYNGLEPHVRRGEIKQIAVVEEISKSTFTPLIHNVPGAHGYAANSAFGFQFPLVSCGATYAPKKVWGYADVAPDGSACFKVPAETPIHFQVLDARGRNLQRMRTFTHFMPGEVQGCTGCHSDRNNATAKPRPTGLFSKHAPQDLQPPEWGVKGFSYREIVQPVLDKYCTSCHNARSAPDGVDLSGDMTDFFNVSYDILARKGTFGEWRAREHGIAAGKEGISPYTSWIPTINGAEHNILMVDPLTWGSPKSKLADLVLAGHPDANGKPRVHMDDASQRRIMAWIDLNVPYYPNSRATYVNAMGCRRLFPVDLDAVLKEVAARRCATCHDKGIPREFFIRVEKPELNKFLLAPLATAAGGTERCGNPVFGSKDDPDYLAILKAFDPVREIMRKTPRDDMPESLVLGSQCTTP